MLTLSDTNRIPSFTDPTVLQDMQALFGGKSKRTFSLVFGFERNLYSPDKHIRASATGLRPREVSVQVGRLTLPENARRRTALWAYEAKRGAMFGQLVMQLPGVHGSQTLTRHQRLTGTEPVFYLDYSPDPDSPALDALDAHLAELDQATARVDAVKYTRNVDAFTEAEAQRLNATSLVGSAVTDSLRTLLYATDSTLPLAARRMAEGYREVAPRVDDPTQAVVSALGAGKLNLVQFNTLWITAMQTDTAVAAGRLVLDALAS